MPYNVMIVGQAGRLAAEAVLFAASLRAVSPDLTLIVAEPQPGPLWPADPRLGDGHRALLAELGAEIRPFESQHFGAAYPYGNKIEGLAVLPPGEPFVFFDTDTLVLSDLGAVGFDFARPAASMRRTATWPVEDAYWPGYEAVWRSLYDRFGLDFASSLNLSYPDRKLAALPLLQRRLVLRRRPRPASGGSFSTMPCRSATTPRPSSPASRSTPGSTRWRCRW